MKATLIPLAFSLALAACSGTSEPPPPVAVASATASPSTDALAPLSSRDRGPEPAARGRGPAGEDGVGGAGMAGGTEPSLPPGHPPIGAADPHGNLARGARAEGAQAGGVSGTVSVARTLKTGPSDVLYIIAKKGPATLAVQRIVQPSFPRAFEISGADAMTPGVGFEGPVDLVARLSKSGDAIPSKGDLEGIRRNVPVPAKGITVTIDTARH